MHASEMDTYVNLSKGKILVVEDEEDIAELITYNLAKYGYIIERVASGEEAMKRIDENAPDIILLDIMLPGLDGIEICKRLKQSSDVSHIPVVMLTARGEEADVVTGLEIGADDYITKPFSPRVLVARVKAILRRQSQGRTNDSDAISIGELSIHPGRHEVAFAGKRLSLTFTEFHVLFVLASRPGWVFTRAQIVDAVRGDGYPVTERSVDVHIVGLRKKLGVAGDFIETVRGVGYRYIVPGTR